MLTIAGTTSPGSRCTAAGRTLNGADVRNATLSGVLPVLRMSTEAVSGARFRRGWYRYSNDRILEEKDSCGTSTSATAVKDSMTLADVDACTHAAFHITLSWSALSVLSSGTRPQ